MMRFSRCNWQEFFSANLRGVTDAFQIPEYDKRSQPTLLATPRKNRLATADATRGNCRVRTLIPDPALDAFLEEVERHGAAV
jgi:hypothetical protein